MREVLEAPAEALSPAFDARAFRNALGTFPTGVAIITTRGAQDGPTGLTCNSFSSVSLEPPLVSWSLRKASKSLEVFRAAPAFAINILAEDQNELSGRFASSRIERKFEGVAWRPGHRESPVLAGCLASFECETFAVHDAGDHLLFIGEVKRFGQERQDDPLVFYKGAYVMLTQSLRELVARGHAAPAELNDARGHMVSLLLRLACAAGTSEDFDAIERHLATLESFTAADIDKRMQAGVQFYRLIAQAAHNPVLTLVSESLNTMLLHVYRGQIAQARALRPDVDLVNAAVIPLRRRLLERLRARDAEGADAALQECLRHSSLLKPVEALLE